MHDYTSNPQLKPYLARASSRIPAAAGALIAAAPETAQLQLVAFAEAAGALIERTQRLAGERGDAGGVPDDIARLFACAYHVAAEPEDARVFALISAAEFTRLDIVTFHRELADALQHAAAAARVIEITAGRALGPGDPLSEFVTALGRQAAIHALLADRALPGAAAAPARPRGPYPMLQPFRMPAPLTIAAAADELGLPTGASLEPIGAVDELHEDWDRMCPGEPWLTYAADELDAIEAGTEIPTRIVRDLVAEHMSVVDPVLTIDVLAARLGGFDVDLLARRLGAPMVGGPVQPARRLARTMTIEFARDVICALGMPPEEVPGL
jgi:hypothetical protein